MNAGRPNDRLRHRATAHPRRRAAVLVYSVVTLVALLAVCSLAVDLGRVQAVKTDLQRCADATARGNLVIYQVYGQSTAQYYGSQIPGQNPVDTNSGIAPTVTIQWGTWNAAAGTFTPGSYTSASAAVQVTASRSAANNNAIPLTWAAVFGRRSCDVSCTSVAALVGTASATVTVSGTSDPWLASMPAGTTASYDDTTANASPYQVTSIPVVPGSYVTFAGVAGTVLHGKTGTSDGPEGSGTYSHGIDSPGGPTPAAENGIADVVAPIDGLVGVFLDNNRPDLTSAPSRRDYTTAASRDQAAYDDIRLKQPFFIGDGQTTAGTVQTFRVPPGATRLYLGTMDGYEWNNNSGSFTATINVLQSVSIVK